MADQYLVHCGCGIPLHASVHQAGSKLDCTCGKQVDVPPLRKLRQLPIVDTEPAVQASKWTPRESVTVAGAALAAGLLLWAAYSWVTEPPPPEFPQQLYAREVKGMLENGTPQQFWTDFVMTQTTLTENGFPELVSLQDQETEAFIVEQQASRNIALVMAAAVAVMTAVVWAAWPKPIGIAG